ncbi:proline-rich protein 11 isoform X3 [Erythrolamprus reginae]|uniref:proline-rich protein 11 isoform X3 n=1 Tax=Erythrolamprus reginae TaxID=121349 RepID=UPI00396CAFF9
MARVKRGCQKRRSRIKSLSKERKHITFTASSSLPSKGSPPMFPVILPSQRRPFFFWLLAFGDILETLKRILATAVGWFWWCQRHVAKILHLFVGAGIPSYARLEELKELRADVKNLKREMAELQSILQQNGGTMASAKNPPCQLSPNLLSASPAHTQLGVTQPAPLSSQNLQIPIPPPPPPPPLPPPPPPPAPLVFKRRSDIEAAPVKNDLPLQITPQDLLNVKLKKTKNGAAMEKETSPPKGRKALITLQDLQSICLQAKNPQPLPRVTNLLKDGLDFRKHLKKVAIKRSPGGTPMNNKENIETGTGLTPLMTQALRRKFQLAHPRSPSPSYFPTRNSFEEQS